jgi:hypothetical protein
MRPLEKVLGPEDIEVFERSLEAARSWALQVKMIY